ncbi:MAG TPA: hypothetical protein VI365_03935 [Trebonia sp.]
MASFTRTDAGPFWILDPAPAACAVGYLPFGPASPPGPTVTLTDSWRNYPGSYLIVPAGTALDQTLADALRTFLAGRPLRLVWAANPQQPASRWQASWIASDGAAVSALSGLYLGSFALWLGAGCAIGPDSGGDDLTVTQRSGDPGSVYLTADSGQTMLAATAPVTLPFTADQAGCALTSLNLRIDSDLDGLDVGLRIFVPDARQPLLPDRLTSRRFPVFSAVRPGPGARLPVTLSLHPLLPLDSARSCFELVPGNAGSGPELASAYQTSNGLAVHLTPLARPDAPAAAARFAFAVRALSDPPSPLDPYYLVPSGAFLATVVNADGAQVPGVQRLMCGTSGIEYVLIEEGSELWFSPGGPALAAGQGLQADATTGYVSVLGPSGAAGRVYRAQADSAALFAPSGTDGFMSFRELSGMPLPGAPAGGGLPSGYPMLPFTRITDTDVQPYQQLEYEAVSSTRRAIIGGLAGALGSSGGPPAPSGGALSPSDSPSTTASITPQGLLVDVDGPGNVVNLTLALSPAGHLVLGQVTADLAAALQSSQLFLVASDPATLCAAQPAKGGPVQIPGPSGDASQSWTINAWPATAWSATSTLLVLKFAGRSLTALAADTSSWAGDGGTRFNPGAGGVAAAQSVLQALIAKAATSTDPEFAPFAALAEDPDWQGMLFLNAPVPPAELPAQVAGLAAGLDASAFQAHHLGLTVTPATVSGGIITQANSSLFGLIYYENAASAANAQPPYAFNVSSLKVRFENSTVCSFTSQLQLLVDELFGEAADLVDPQTMASLPDNVLLLDGVYQQQGGTGGYTFSTPNANLFAMDSAVLDTVEVSSAQFVTVIPPGTPGTPAESRFVMSGALRFQPAVLDVFSFGPESVDTPAARLSAGQLRYSNLWISLDYVSGDRSQDVYTFDASKLVPDPVQSVAREQSLFAGFPLTLAGFLHVPPQAAGAQDKPATPASLGFLGIGTTPSLGGSISAPWFGLVADLGFGTAGALAAEAGFKASMLMSWSPGSAGQAANAGIGLKLPGTGPGGKLLSLQGVLKLKIGELSLSKNDGTYVLQLDRIALNALMLTFPSAGQLDALLFADPAGKDRTTLGWYAGYAQTGGS